MFLSFSPWSATLAGFCILLVYFEGTVFGASSSHLIYILLSIKKKKNFCESKEIR